MKSLLEEQDALGCTLLDGAICESCLGDPCLFELLAESSITAESCRYCGAESCVQLEGLQEVLSKALRKTWMPVGEAGLPYDSETKSLAFEDEQIDVWDLLYNELHSANEQLVEDLSVAFSDYDGIWVKQSILEGDHGWLLTSGWKDFADTVKHRSRFVFLPNSNDTDVSGVQKRSRSVIDFLYMFKDLVRVLELIKCLDRGSLVFRGRVHKPGRRFRTAKDLSAPPTADANFANRMSPAGIPMFYGGFSKQACALEVNYDRRSEKKFTVGKFKTQRELVILDLTVIPQQYARYQPEFDEIREQMIIFLKEFREDFSKPIEKDDRCHIEYVPTQVLTEYIKEELYSEQGRRIDGIRYESSRDRGKHCIVLFMQNEHAVDLSALSRPRALSAREFEPWLELIETTTE